MALRERRPGIGPRRTAWHMLDGLARRIVPMAACVLAVLLLDVPLRLPSTAELLPGFLLASVFFWSVFQPASMPAIGVFLVGLFSDLLGSTPPGTMPLLLLLTHWFAGARREALSGYGFIAVWSIFALIAIVASLLQWGLASLSRLQAMPPAPALFEAALACALYPPLSACFGWAHRTIADPRRT
jgi:rod shape-determining protein MreD